MSSIHNQNVFRGVLFIGLFLKKKSFMEKMEPRKGLLQIWVSYGFAPINACRGGRSEVGKRDCVYCTCGERPAADLTSFVLGSRRGRILIGSADDMDMYLKKNQNAPRPSEQYRSRRYESDVFPYICLFITSTVFILYCTRYFCCCWCNHTCYSSNSGQEEPIQ